MSRPFLFLLCACATFAVAAEDPAEAASRSDKIRSPASPLAWPEVRSETKPWTRWWWFGNIADEKSITSEMEKYAAAGLGGLEITPIYGVRGYEERFVSFLSPRWISLLEHTLAEGRRLGLGIDLATGTGWPFGGPWLEERDTAHSLSHKTYTVAAGERLAPPVTLEAKPFLRFAGAKRVPLADVRQPLSANSNLQDLAIDQVRFEKPLELVSLIAFPIGSDRADRPLPPPIDLTRKVDAQGRLDWTAPSDGAPWSLHALFSGLHGKLVERAAPGAEGYALDHFSSHALENYLRRFDERFAGRQVAGLRAFFNDSYEVDDADGEANWTANFLDEFQRRRGYDLRHHLPELFGTSGISRVVSDFRETVSDLLLEEFTKPWRAWANSRGAQIRNQAHGSPANILDLYAASDIPEQEGNGLLAMKLASSAAHLTGKPLASAETATWLNEHWLTTLAELKQNADVFLLSGINHVCYHGTPFSPPNDPWPGFNFYASVELTPASPLWTDFPALNAYVARAQSFLQAGYSDEDVLLYYNIHDRWAERGDGRLPHFGHGSDPIGTGARDVAASLRAAGLGFDFFSDRLLQAVEPGAQLVSRRASDTALAGHPVTVQAGQVHYQAIVLPATRFMPLATLERLVTLAEQGATILVEQHLPQHAPGFAGLSQQAAFDRVLARIQEKKTSKAGTVIASVGHGRFVIGPSMETLLAQAGLRTENLGAPGLEYLRRRTDRGFVYFLVNRNDHAFEGWMTLRSPAASAALFDPMTGQNGIAAIRTPDTTSSTQVYLQLPPAASIFVQLSDIALDSPRWNYTQTAGNASGIEGAWEVSFTSGGPELPSTTSLEHLSSWTDFAGEAGRAFSGTAVYKIKFDRPVAPADAWQLDLGSVADSARITLNDRELTTLIQPPWRTIILSDTLRATNTLEVAVTNLPANRLADLDRRGAPWKKFYNVNMPARLRENVGPDGLFTAAHWAPRPSGLLGPVTLAPLKIVTP
jgi:hypothetical protein